jgi:hypothetical protein
MIYASLGQFNLGQPSTTLDGQNGPAHHLEPPGRSRAQGYPLDLAHCFLRLANLPSYPLDRLSRYEAVL